MINGTDSSKTFYLLNQTGKKIPIVFIHGVALTHKIWQPQLDYFNNKKLKGEFVIVIEGNK